MILILSLSLSSFSADVTTVTPAAKTKPTRIAVFKNGLGFVTRSGETDIKNHVVELDPLPDAALGALWFSTDNPVHRITEVTSTRRREKVPVPAANLVELLRANIGKKARIGYTTAPAADTSAYMEFEIVAVPEDRIPAPTAATDAPDYLSARSRWANVLPAPETTRGEVVILRNMSGQILALHKNSIQSVQFSDADLNTTLEKEIVRTRLRFDSASDKANVHLMYLQKGWNWSPSYLINLQNEKKAKLTLEAVFANDIEDIENAEISFVVGYPNFSFTDIAHPLSSRQSIADLVQAILAHNQDRFQPNYGHLVQNSVAYSDASVSSTYSPNDFARDASQSSEDLFLFRQSAVTLPKGSRARFTLLDQTIPYEHIYEWRLGDTAPQNPYDQQERRKREKENEVWHTIRLTNDTKQPWTTAPALAVNGQLPVAQDTLKYTPPGASSSVRITVASDIRANEISTELSRTPVSIYGTTAAKVSLRNELTVRNFKSTAVKLAVHRAIQGEAADNTTATIQKTGRDLTTRNPTQTLTWDFQLAPNAEKKLQFDYTTITTR